METTKIKKGHILQYSGDSNTKAYMVISGLLRSYSIDENGKEHIFMFAPEDWYIADNNSNGLGAELYIDALEDSELIILGVTNDFEVNPKKIIKRLAVLQKRIIMLMSATALERYNHFVATYPQIVQRVPQKMIASYLGITPEALSRVKKQG